jgi:hypothetical protein
MEFARPATPESPMPESPILHQPQKLVRCEVANRYNETSVRFVELGNYRLWEFLMTSRHGLRVQEPALCLWIEQGEYERGAEVFDRAGEVEAVDCIVVDLFDAEYGFSQTITRYARAGESHRVVEVLRSHIPPELRGSESCRIDVVGGRAVQQWHPNARRNIMLGLEG